MTAPDARVQALRGEVETLFGRCLLRLQRCEHLVKKLVTGHQVSAGHSEDGSFEFTPVADAGRKTLGQAVGEMLGAVVSNDGQRLMEEEGGDAPVTMRVGVTLPVEDYLRIETEFGELVELRNGLAHHFLIDHDLDSVEGCGRAIAALEDVLARVGPMYDALSQWVRELEQARFALAEILRDPAVLSGIIKASAHND